MLYIKNPVWSGFDSMYSNIQQKNVKESTSTCIIQAFNSDDKESQKECIKETKLYKNTTKLDDARF